MKPKMEKTFIPEELQPYAQIQRAISDLSNKTIDSTVELITTTPILKSENYIDFIVKEIFIVVPLRQKNWEIYVELCNRIQKASNDVIVFRDFKKLLLDTAFKVESEWEMHSKATYLHFIRLCLKGELFTVNDIVNRLSYLKPSLPLQYFLSVCYFAPEVSVASPSIYQSFVKVIRKFAVTDDQTKTETQTTIMPGVSGSVKRIKDPIFQEYVNMFDNLCENNYERLIPLIETGCELRSVEYDIFMDDVETLKTKIGKTYKVNRKVTPNPFHPAMFVQWKPTLLELAAFYGSIDCFNFLIKMNASPQFISIMATAGGNIELMERVKELGMPYDNCLRIAAAFRNFEAFDWIMKNCGEQFRFHKEINYVWGRAAYTNYLPMLDYCVINDVDINHCDENDQTALHLAADKDNKEAVLFLVNLPKIQFRKKNVFGWNPHSMTKNKEIIKIIDDAEELHKKKKKDDKHKGKKQV